MRSLFVPFVIILLSLPVYAAPSELWSYSDTCAVFSMALNSDGYIGLAFGYYAELLSPDGKLLLKAPTRGIAYSTALSGNNLLIIGTEGSWVQAFNDSKRPIWEYRLRSPVVTVSVSDNGSVAVAGDASGYIYLFRDGKLSWEKKVGNYTWSTVISNGVIYVGSDSGIRAFSLDGKSLWSSFPGAAVRKIVVAGDRVVALAVPKSEEWSELVVFTFNGKELWRKRFNGYTRTVDSDGRAIAVAGSFGNVTLFSLNGKLIYEVPLIGYAYDVATMDNYTVVSFAKEAELIGQNGSVVWFQRFNGTAYHVAFSPRGYFLTEYGSHDVQNCYSVIVAWSLGNVSTETASTAEPQKAGTNPYILAGLLAVVFILGALLWRKR
ncbi:PQQ-binding-like beta-propeller repeat protein [Thermococcus sp.]|uniref:outer membrane protein assembly factor BamB family protein n=1 Tax=Thermococcus sp. TaxID=35749 RepID=UPI002637DFB8|nr:PQQ-binding-like beta-propeller repeat protein [Thermococcus sp.]